MAIQRCPKCGTQVNVSVYDCPRCGRALVSQGKRWMARVPWMIATLALALLVWWLLRRRG
jgi:uncharacterized paraquat-inducible protein A